MKNPAFWSHKTALSTLLLPLGRLYYGVSILRRAVVPPYDCGVPVICIGNLTAGGSGKTPVALYIGERLKQKNIRAFFLSRGYGGAQRGPLLVDSAMHNARDVGDEPLLLSRVLPTIICKDRKQGAVFAVAQGAELIIMDDGFQNPSLKKTLSLIVMDSSIGMGNGRLIPAGPLREPAASGLNRADAIIILSRLPIASEVPPGKPIFFGQVQASSPIPLAGKNVVAFCGIAYPQKFFETLAGLGATVVAWHPFADHYPYRPDDISALAQEAESKNALLVTTAKDAVRLTPANRARVTVVEIALDFAQGDELDALLAKAIA